MVFTPSGTLSFSRSIGNDHHREKKIAAIRVASNQSVSGAMACRKVDEAIKPASGSLQRMERQ
jgi:hypothetical protein